MARRRPVGRYCAALLLFALAAPFLAFPAQAAQPGPADPVLRAQLEAGEFAPAVEAARRLPSLQERDAVLAQIAVAQAQAGAQQASLQTAAQIRGDQARAETLSGIALQPVGGLGGGQQADFDSLIDLITSTIQPTTWDEVGGPGSIAPFPTGVHVDAQGLLQPLLKTETGSRLAALRAAAGPRAGHANARRQSPLRMVSLTRLEKQVQLRQAAGLPPTEEMQVLAGLQRVQYVFVYPDSGDLVLAGPAGGWQFDGEDRVVSAESGRPVVRLDDLVVALRHLMSGPDARFGCMINPRQEALARVQEFLNKSSKAALATDDRRGWLGRLRAQLGKQDIEVYGLDPRTRAARVMVEADYRMKLVGMGLEEGVPGVKSYLAMVEVPPGGSPPPMGVLRWWFTLNYESVLASQDRRAFALRGQGVKVLSENERLTAEGKRVHTGQSDELNRRFAQSFTEHFDELAAKYPIYAELQNLFDLALVGAILREEDLCQKTAWHMTCFGDPKAFQVETAPAPKEVETVVNHRVINDRKFGKVHVIAGVSGGVSVHPADVVTRQSIQVETGNTLRGRQGYSAPKPQLRAEAWWWD